MKIFITGVSGMLGSHLSELLIKKKHKVVGIDNLSVGRIENLKKVISNKNFKFFKYDLKNKKKLNFFVKRCDVVVHLAAIKKVSEHQSSFNTLDVNVNSTKNILEASKKFKKKVIFASTSDVYGISKKIPFKESGDLVYGQSLAKRWAYAVSKLYCEHLCYCYHKDFNLNVTILRYFGGFSEKSSFTWSGGHIPVFINQLLTNQKVTIHGDGKQTRSMGHADDLAKGTYLALMSKKVNGKIFNIGNNEELSVIKSLRIIADELKIKLNKKMIKFIPEKKIYGNYKDLRRRIPDLTSAKNILGYKPRITFREAIKLVINEHKKSK